MAEYILEVYNLNNITGIYTRIGEITTFFGLEFTQKSNKPSTASFNLNVYSPDTRFIIPFQSWILIKRNGIPYLFNIIDVRGDLNPDSGELQVMCGDMLYVLNQNYIEGNYIAKNTDAGTIASALVSLAESKPYNNLGIVNGVIQTVGNTNETLFYSSIGKALTNQADNIAGYNFNFIPTLDANSKLSGINFNVYATLGVNRTNLPPLELGYSVNALSFGMVGEVYNKVYTLGEGTNDVTVVTSENNTSKAIFGLRESVNKESSITIRQSLQDKGDSRLVASEGIRLEIAFELTEGISPYFGDFGLMDTLRVNINIGNTFFNFEGDAQITELAFRYDNNNNKETITPVILYNKV